MHLPSLVAWLGLVAACDFQARLGPADAQGEADARRDDADVTADAAVDAPPGPQCVQIACELAGGTCTNGVCVIDNDLQTAVICPGGMPCKVICDTVDACKAGGVDCGMATSCEVLCIGTATCQGGGVDCRDATACKVRCEGTAACQNGNTSDLSVECRTSTCSVTCTGMDACQDGIDVEPGGACTSHCCDGACQGGFDTCTNDNVCT